MPMSQKSKSQKTSTSNGPCTHTTLTFTSSSHADQAGYHRPTVQQRSAATTPQGRPSQIIDLEAEANDSSTFPAPLILPGDDLAIDPKHPPQSLRAWIRERERNEVTHERGVIYVVAPPEVDGDSDGVVIRSWRSPALVGGEQDFPAAAERDVKVPDVEDVRRYLAAFYYGLPVKILESSSGALRFTAWDDDDIVKSSSRRGRKQGKSRRGEELEDPAYIGLRTSTEMIRIRTRSSSSVFRRQLNLDDLLDVAISILPSDAYALLLLVNHDLYEDEDDDFCCGRAYGGSRVAVVSTARYHPGLDGQQGVERVHAWPGSHCEEFVRRFCAANAEDEEEPSRILPAWSKRKKGKKTREEEPGAGAENDHQVIQEGEVAISPLQAALQAHNDTYPNRASLSTSASALEGLWLGRVCKTASHELGHCFGIDHCVYYACIMQGTASLAEDARQPPYLCPVDEAKLVAATGMGEMGRREGMIEFCEGERNRKIGLFRAFGAWLRARSEM